MTGAHVLIVEDEFLIRMTLAEVLADAGFDVTEAGSSDEALRLADGGDPFDLMLTDVQLPGSMNGLELARHMRERQPTLPVIYVTGRPEHFDGAAAHARDLCIAKPYRTDDIRDAARKLIGCDD